MKQGQRNILVTGGAGFIGSHLVDKICSCGDSVVVVDNLSTGSLDNLKNSKGKFKLIQDDLETFNLNEIGKVDAVVHLAAQTSVPLSIKDFRLSSTQNILSTLNVFNYCKEFMVPVVYASSSAVYGELPIGDDASKIVDLLSPYATDKYAMELYAEVLCKLYNVSSLGLRFFNVYGPRQDPHNPYSGVISIFAKKMLSNQKVQINGGFQTRDFVFVEDVVISIERSIELVTSKLINDNVNVLTGKPITVDKLFDLMADILEVKPAIVRVDLPKGDPEKSDGTPDKMIEMLGSDPRKMVDLYTGLVQTLAFMQSQEGEEK